MNRSKQLISIAPAALLLWLPALWLPTAVGAHHGPSTDQIALPFEAGTVEISIRPDGRRPLRLNPMQQNLWAYEGPLDELVGKSYTVKLRNRSGERIKVVLGVDGVNVYRKQSIEGHAESDVGSILNPWSTREIPGWQLDLDHAQRFVFSPPEWSEGHGIQDSKIGTLSVAIYRERQPESRIYERRRPEVSEKSLRSDLEALGYIGRHRTSPEPERSEDQGLGTTSGDDLEHTVRTVRFNSETSIPTATAVIHYGRQAPPSPSYDRIGLDLEPTFRGPRVRSVAAGSIAAQAGIEDSDIILRVDSVPNPTPNRLRNMWYRKANGDYIFLRIQRGRLELSIKAKS